MAFPFGFGFSILGDPFGKTPNFFLDFSLTVFRWGQGWGELLTNLFNIASWTIKAVGWN